MADTLDFAMETPVEFKGETISSLTFRRRRVKDLVAMDSVKGDLLKTIAMYASMCDRPLPVLEAMDADDFERMIEETQALLGKRAAAAMDRQAKEPDSL